MSIALVFLVVGAVVGLLALAFSRLPPRRAGAVLVFGAALGLASLRQFSLAIPVALVGWGMWRRGAPGAPPTRGQNSAAASRRLAMTLDHDSGEIDGEVLAGPYAGLRLSELSLTDLQALMAEFETAADSDSLSLLLAYLERRRDGGQPDGPPPPAAPTALTEAEAYRILGLPPGASVEDVREAYRRLIRRVHPDLGGTSALAAMLNAAKELLDPGPARPH